MKWHALYEKCSRCGRTSQPFKAAGLCNSCYAVVRYQTNPKCRAQSAAAKKRYALRHADTIYARISTYKAKNPAQVKRHNNEYRARVRRTVFVRICGKLLRGWVERFYFQDCERVADVKLSSGRIVTLPIKALIRVKSLGEAEAIEAVEL